MAALQPKNRNSSRLAWLPILLYLALTAVALYLDPNWVVEPAWLLPILNLVFRLGVGVAIAALAARAYLQGASLAMLALGGGMLTMAAGTTISALFVETLGPRASVPMHNVAVLAAGALLVAAALGTAFSGQVRLPGSRRRQLALAYGALLALQGLLAWAILAGALPPFFVQGRGPTPLRQLVLGIAVVEYLLSALFFAQARVRTGFAFFRWYAYGQLLFGVGLAVIFQQHSLGGLVNWAGRWGQFLGGAYLMAGVLTTLADAQRRGLSPAQAFGASLLQAGLAYRPLVESTADAVVVLDAEGRVLYWNEAAHRLFGYEAVEVFGMDFLDAVRADDPLLPGTARLPPTSGTVELRLAHRGGTWFPAEVSVYHDRAEGVQTVCIVRDITERKQAEAALRQANESLERRVAERTAALQRANAELRREMEERRQAELALRQSEERFKTLTAATFEGVAITEGGRYVDANDQWLAMIGYSRQELIGREVGADIPVEDRERVLANIREGREARLEHAVIRKDGTRIIVETHGRTVDHHNRKVRFTAIRDVTETRQREQALQRSERRLRTFFESDMVGTLFWTRDGRVTDANDKFLRMVGYTRQDLLVGRVAWAEMTPPEYRARDEHALAELEAMGVDTPYEKEYIRKDGTRVPIIIGAATLDEQRREGVAFVLDITERKQAEEALRQRERDLAVSQEIAHVGNWSWDIVHDRITWSDEMYRIFGVDPAAFGADLQSLNALVHPDDLPVQERAKDALLAGEPVGAFEYRVIRPDGTERVVRVLEAKVVRGADGRPVRMVGVVIDVTEVRRAEQALRASLREKEAALATNQTLLREVHHRVKNNLQMLCDLMYLQMEAMPDRGEQQHLQDAYGRIYAIARLHEQLYQSMERGRVRLRDYFAQLAVGLNDVYPRATVRIEPPPTAIYLDLDRAIHAGLIVNELVTNAAKHAFPNGAPGEITVALQSLGDQVQLQVRDNGTGLPAHVAPEDCKSLGLRIVRILACRLNATVKVERTHGTTFSLTFPLHAEMPVEPPHEQQSPPPSD